MGAAAVTHKSTAALDLSEPRALELEARSEEWSLAGPAPPERMAGRASRGRAPPASRPPERSLSGRRSRRRGAGPRCMCVAWLETWGSTSSHPHAHSSPGRFPTRGAACGARPACPHIGGRAWCVSAMHVVGRLSASPLPHHLPLSQLQRRARPCGCQGPHTTASGAAWHGTAPRLERQGRVLVAGISGARAVQEDLCPPCHRRLTAPGPHHAGDQGAVWNGSGGLPAAAGGAACCSRPCRCNHARAPAVGGTRGLAAGRHGVPAHPPLCRTTSASGFWATAACSSSLWKGCGSSRSVAPARPGRAPAPPCSSSRSCGSSQRVGRDCGTLWAEP